MAVNCWVAPLAIDGVAGVTAIDTRVAGADVRVTYISHWSAAVPPTGPYVVGHVPKGSVLIHCVWLAMLPELSVRLLAEALVPLVLYAIQYHVDGEIVALIATVFHDDAIRVALDEDAINVPGLPALSE